MGCEKHPELLSQWSDCIIPHGNLADAINNLLRSVKHYGCKLPPKKIVNFGLSFLRNNSNHYLDHPLYKRITTKKCGQCGRRVRCCKRSKSFLAQAYMSDSCSGSPDACIFDPLVQQDISQLKDLYPTITPPADGCDVSAYIQAELTTLSAGPAYQYIEPLLCQILGTKFPAVNCLRYADKCHCCCFAYTPSPNGTCVLDNRDLEHLGCNNK